MGYCPPLKLPLYKLSNIYGHSNGTLSWFSPDLHVSAQLRNLLVDLGGFSYSPSSPIPRREQIPCDSPMRITEFSEMQHSQSLKIVQRGERMRNVTVLADNNSGSHGLTRWHRFCNCNCIFQSVNGWSGASFNILVILNLMPVSYAWHNAWHKHVINIISMS